MSSDSEKVQLAAVLALMGGKARAAYGSDEVEKLRGSSLPAFYNEVHVMERLPSGPRRTSLPSQQRQWRILVRSVAQRYDNAQEMRDRAYGLHEALLTVGGVVYGIERSTSDDPISPDDGWFSGTSEFIY